MLLIVSTPPPKISFNLALPITHKPKSLFINEGTSKVTIRLDKDSYLPGEAVNVNVDVDNTKCDQSVNRVKVKMYRHIRAISKNGQFYDEKCGILKRKHTDLIKEKSRKQYSLELPLGQIDIKDKYLERVIKQKPHLYTELK